MNYNGTGFDGMSPKAIREACEDMVSGPGKFEGEQDYSPWFYYLLGVSGEDESFETPDGITQYLFIIGPEDRNIFRELEGVEALHGWETDTGFWCAERCTVEEWETFKTDNEGSEE